MAELQIDPEALKYAHELFKKDGYNGDVNSFKSLISKDNEALDYSYKLFKKDGYNGSLDDYKSLVIDKPVKKKEPSQQGSQPISPEKVWGSKSQPKSVYDTLVTGQAKQVGASVTSAGKPKPKPKADGVEWTGGAGSFTIGINQEYKKRADKFAASTKLTDDEKEKERQAVDSEWNNVGVWNNIKRYAGAATKIVTSLGNLSDISGGIMSGISTAISKTPGSEFLNEQKIAKKQLLLEAEEAKRNGELPPVIDDNAIAERTKANILDKRLTSLKESKERNYLIDAERNVDASGLSEKDKIERFDTQKLNTLKHIDRVELQKQNVLRPAYEESIKDLNASILKANNLVKSKQQIPQDLTNEILEKQNNLKQQEKDLQDSYGKFLNNRKELGSAIQNLDVVKRDYTWGKNFLNTLGASSLELMSGISAVPEYSANIMENIIGKNRFTKAVKEHSRWEADLYGNEALKLRDEISKPVSIEDVHEMSDFGDWFRNTFVASQAPILGATLAGGWGIAAIGASSTGNAYERMIKEMEEGKANYSTWQLAAIPAAHGGIDSVQAILESNLLKGAGRTIASATTAEKQLMAEGFWKPIGEKLLPKLAKSIPHSNAWFAGITMSKNILTKYGEGKEDVQITDGLKDSFAMATAMGGLLPVMGHIGSEIVKPFSIDSKITNLSGKIVKLESELQVVGIDPVIRKEKQELLDTYNKNVSELLVKKIKDIKSLSNEQFTEVLDINKEQANLHNRAKDVKEFADPKDAESTQDILNGLKDKFKELEERRINILQKGPGILLERLKDPEYIKELKDQAEKRLVKEAKAKGKTEFKFTDDDISREAIAIHNEKLAIKKGYDDYDKRVAEEQAKPTEEKVWYYNEDAKRGPVESAPETLPEGYTSAKPISNSVELERWKSQTEPTPTEVTPTEKTQGTPDVISEPIEVDRVLSGQKVIDIINRPAILESQAGFKLEIPIEGDVYQEGKRVIFEDKNKKTYDLGNIDELSDKAVEELGIKPQEEMVSITENDKIKIGNSEWNMQLELPNYGIEYDKNGDVKAVSLKDDAGKTIMYEGQIAEDSAYQILLKQAEIPENRLEINKILEKDEEFNRQLREVEKPTKKTTSEVIEPVTKQTEKTTTKKEQLRKSVDEASKALQDAWNNMKSDKLGFALDPNERAKQDLKKQAEFHKAIIDYGVAKFKEKAFTVKELIEDLASKGIEISEKIARDLHKRIDKAHLALLNLEQGTKSEKRIKSSEQKIKEAYNLGVKETEAQAKDALSAQKEVLGIEKAEALSEQAKKFKEQKESIKQSIKDKIEKSKDAIKNINQIVAESLPLDKLSKAQVKSILNNAMKIFTYANVENGVANFVDHVDKVINNIDHVRNLENLETLRKKSFQNLLKAKVSPSLNLTNLVSKVLSIKPEHIPSEVMSDYTRILDKLGDNADKRIEKLISEIPKAKGAELLKKQAELKELKENQIKDRAELIQMANKVMDAFQANRNKVIELSDSYNSYIENNNLQGESFSKVVKKMEADDIITETEADLMRSNSDYYVERKAREGKKGEILEQRESLTERVNQTLQSLNSREGVEYRKNSLDKESILEANKVVGKVTKEYLDSLSDNELETVLNELNALDGGFVTANLRKVANGIELFEREKAVTPILSDAKLKWWEGAKSTIKAAYYGIKGDKVKSSVWYHKLQGAHNNIIDTVVNNLKNNDLYKNTSDKAAKLWGQSKTYIDINQNKYINPLSNLIEKQAKGDSAEIMKSNIKTSLYLYQKMHDSSLNKGKDIHVEEYVKTANKNKVYSDETLNEINSALEKFREKDFDVDRWYNEELTDAERKVVDGIRDFYDSDIKEKAKSTSYFDDGRLIDTSNPDYIPVDFAFADNTDVQIDNLIKNKTEAFYNPSVKAGNLMDKVGSSGGMNKSLNLTNPFKTMETYLTDVSTQYHMMNEVRIQNQLYKKLLANKSFSKSSLELINAMKAGNDKVVSSWLENAYKETGFWGSVFDKRITKQLLSGFGKFAAEGVGNAINMVNHFGEVADGIKILNENSLSIEQIDNAMYNAGISQAYRFIGKAISIESPFKNQGDVDMPLTRKLKMDSNMPNEYINMMNNLYKRTKTKAVLDQIDMLHDALRVTPDKSLSKPLALGIFQKRFQSLSGELPNWQKLASGDAEYMRQNKEFIDVASSSANLEGSLVIGSQNPYEKAGKQLITKDSNVYSKANGFFQGYSMAQGSAFQVALKNLLYNGAISKVEASIMVAQRISSQTAYLTISKGIQKGMLALVGGALGYTLFKDDEEEEGARKRNIVASAVQLAMSRTGAVGSNLAAFAFEKGSEKYGQGVLYEGEYTKGKATMFSAYDPKKTAGENFLNVGLQSMGQRWVTVSKGKEVVTDFAKGEWKTGMFDIAGSLGYIPLYKDVNSVVGGLKYQGLPSKEITQGMTSAEKIELEEKKVPKALETTFKNLVIAKKRFLNKEISKDEWHKIKNENKKVLQSILNLGPIDDSVFEGSIDKMVESVGVRSGKYEGIEDFRKMNSNDRKEYLYNIVKDVKKGEKIPQDVKDKVGKIIKAGLVKESEVGDVVRYYQKYK